MLPMCLSPYTLSPSASGLVLPLFFACRLPGFLATPCAWQSWPSGRHSRHPCTPRVLASKLCPGTLTSTDLAHHGPHLAELIEQLVDFLDTSTTAKSDTFTPTAVDDVRATS